MKRVYMVVNTIKDPTLSFTKEVIAWLEDQSVEVFLPTKFQKTYELDSKYSIEDSALDTIDFAIVLGGDGTIIHSSICLAKHGLPILGINIGSLGFLTQIEQSEWQESLMMVLEGRYGIHERMMLEAHVIDTDRDEESGLAFALNDVVVSRMALSRMVGFSLYVNDQFVNFYSADGVIISTPTGSTAYNLSAGGPILAPNGDTMVVTPICPHSLSARSIVLSSHDVVKITFEHNRRLWENDLMLTVDGHEGIKLNSGSEIVIKRASMKTKLLHLEGHNFYKILRHKLGSN